MGGRVGGRVGGRLGGRVGGRGAETCVMYDPKMMSRRGSCLPVIMAILSEPHNCQPLSEGYQKETKEEGKREKLKVAAP